MKFGQISVLFYLKGKDVDFITKKDYRLIQKGGILWVNL